MNDNLQRLIALAKADGGKFFIMDEQGVPQLVIMGIAEYEQVLLKKVQGIRQEAANLESQIASKLNNQSEPLSVKNEIVKNPVSEFSEKDLRSEVIDSTFA